MSHSDLVKTILANNESVRVKIQQLATARLDNFFIVATSFIDVQLENKLIHNLSVTPMDGQAIVAMEYLGEKAQVVLDTAITALDIKIVERDVLTAEKVVDYLKEVYAWSAFLSNYHAQHKTLLEAINKTIQHQSELVEQSKVAVDIDVARLQAQYNTMTDRLKRLEEERQQYVVRIMIGEQINVTPDTKGYHRSQIWRSHIHKLNCVKNCNIGQELV